MRPMSAERALAGLDAAIDADYTQVSVLDVEWAQFVSSNRRERDPFFEDVQTARRGELTSETAAASIANDLFDRVAAAPQTRRRTLLVDAIDERARSILGTNGVKHIDPRRPLRELGLDSLMAVELRNAIGARLSLTLPATLLFDYPAIENVADYVLREYFAHDRRPAAAEPSDVEAERAQRAMDIDELDNLSADEAEKLLLAELNAAEE
jgi:acyl carrier protein